jgi:hypothetical protein
VNEKIGSGMEMVMLFLQYFQRQCLKQVVEQVTKVTKTISQHLSQDSHPQSPEYTSRVLKILS